MRPPGYLLGTFWEPLGGLRHLSGASWAPKWRLKSLPRVILDCVASMSPYFSSPGSPREPLGASWEPLKSLLGASWEVLGASWKALGHQNGAQNRLREPSWTALPLFPAISPYFSSPWEPESSKNLPKPLPRPPKMDLKLIKNRCSKTPRV